MLVSQAPSEVEPKQLKELHIKPDIEGRRRAIFGVKHRQELIKIQMSRLVYYQSF